MSKVTLYHVTVVEPQHRGARFSLWFKRPWRPSPQAWACIRAVRVEINPSYRVVELSSEDELLSEQDRFMLKRSRRLRSSLRIRVG